MTKYIARLKRKAAGVVRIEIEDAKFTVKDSESLFAPTETVALVISAIDVLKKEGLEWLRIEEV